MNKITAFDLCVNKKKETEKNIVNFWHQTRPSIFRLSSSLLSVLAIMRCPWLGWAGYYYVFVLCIMFMIFRRGNVLDM